MAGADASGPERRLPRQVAWMRLPWILTTLAIEMAVGVVQTCSIIGAVVRVVVGTIGVTIFLAVATALLGWLT
ncbi:MAG: hypothetical protein EHM88_19335 [Candidatus Rokuibacteriota bacterium]|jgi:hypothetical protein|nr:MAG: hypothetical protein EHM88_19335 [Candidatus Rokubacteria bacterium]